MFVRKLWRCAAMAGVLLCVSSGSAAEIDGSLFTSKQWGLRITAPRNWQLSEKTPYPTIILWMSRSGPNGTMLLSVEKIVSGTSTLDYVKKTMKLLRAMDFRVDKPQFHSPSGAYWLDFDDEKSFLRQAYRVHEGTCMVLTLSTPTSRIRNQHLRAFDSSLRSLERFTPAPTSNPQGSTAPRTKPAAASKEPTEPLSLPSSQK